MAKHKAKITRPTWCLGEMAYQERERLRRRLLRQIKQQAVNFQTNNVVCSGCDLAVWQAELPDDMLWRGCHCITLCLSDAMKEQPFDLAHWSLLTTAGDLFLATL